jgi:hypothetical protein
VSAKTACPNRLLRTTAIERDIKGAWLKADPAWRLTSHAHASQNRAPPVIARSILTFAGPIANIRPPPNPPDPPLTRLDPRYLGLVAALPHTLMRSVGPGLSLALWVPSAGSSDTPLASPVLAAEPSRLSFLSPTAAELFPRHFG